MIEVDQLTKQYDQLIAVSELSFGVARGEILGLVGPNGAGKTSTLRCLCGILSPTKGTLRIAGFDVVDDAVEAKRRLAYVPDSPHPFDLLTVDEHLRFTAMAYRLDDAEERIPRLLEELELLEKRDELASTLSRGMQQKLAIACSFVRDPEVILLDEPLTGLDPRGIRIMRDAIRRRADAGAAILISSHLLELVQRTCDRILVLDRGRGVVCGTLTEIREEFSSGEATSLEELFFSITDRDRAADAS